MLTPAQVAKIANVTPQSIRNWSREYAAFLSPGANAGTRLYTDEDVQILRLIADLRKSGISRDAVAERVRNRGTAPPIVDATASPQMALNEAQNELNVSLPMQIAYNALQSQIDALARRVETQQRGSMLWTLGMGIWIGMVTMGLIFFAVWLIVNGR